MKAIFWLICLCSKFVCGAHVEDWLKIDAEDGIPPAIIEVIKERHRKNELKADLEFSTKDGKIGVQVTPHFVGGTSTLLGSPADFKKWFDSGADPSNLPKSYTQHGPSNTTIVRVYWVKPKQ